MPIPAAIKLVDSASSPSVGPMELNSTSLIENGKLPELIKAASLPVSVASVNPPEMIQSDELIGLLTEGLLISVSSSLIEI